MARSIARSPLFHKGLTVFTSNGTALPLSEPSSADPEAQETESSDDRVSPARNRGWLRDIERGDGA